MEILLYIFVFFCGSCIGSFLNVCIHRLPLKESIVYPRSRCPQCKNEIRWYDNIPLFSFIILKRRCRYCRARIPFQYFIVEFLTGSLFVLLFYYYAFLAQFFIYAVLFSSLIVATFIDFKYQEIPDVIDIPGIFIGLILSTIFPVIQGVSSSLDGFIQSLLGVFAGGASIYLIGVLGKIIFKKEAMGGGDVKLLAMIGAFLGWKLTILTFFIAPFFGAVFGIIVKLKTGESLIPYGPFLSLASLVAAIWGNNILNWLYF
jgi:leader peptidase (prepilin peptidase)/N-methyltransferase